MLRRTLLLVLGALLFSAPAWSIDTIQPDLAGPVYNVMDPEFDAKADAVEAICASFGVTEDTPMYCGTPGTGTNDGPAVTSAAVAAGDDGGGIVRMPCGLYRTGDESFYLDSIMVQQDNIILEGEGPCTVLLPADVNGQAFISVCADDNCDGTTQINNVTIRNLTIRDDDPYNHGYGSYVLAVSNISGEFDYMEPLTMTGGTARFYSQSATTGAGTIIVMEHNHAPVATNTIEGVESGKTATITGVSTPGVEESHGIKLSNCHNCTVENVRIEFTGDEGIDIIHDSKNVTIENNYFHVPGVPSGSAGVMIYESDGVIVTNNHFEGGAAGGTASKPAAIGVVAGSNLDVSHNVIADAGTDTNDHTAIAMGISVNPTVGDITDLDISHNQIDIEMDIWGTCSDTTPATVVCDTDADCSGSDPDDHCENHNRNCEGDETCGAIVASEAGFADIYDVTVSHNTVNGKILLESGAGSIHAVHNIVKGNYGEGIDVNALTTVIIDHNETAGHEHGCIFVSGGSGAATHITDNDCSGSGDGFTTSGHALIKISQVNTADEGTISSNIIRGKNNGSTSVASIDCESATGVSVDGNVINDSDGTGINDCQMVNNNYILDSGGHGIFVFDDDAEITNNTIDDVGFTGITIQTANSVVVNDNHLKNTGQNGIFLDTVTGGTVSGNYAEGDGSHIGISCDDCNTTKIIGNTVENFLDAGAISIIESGGTSDYNICMGNISLDSGSTILCGDGTSAGDDVGCTAEAGTAANTYCGGNVIGP